MTAGFTENEYIRYRLDKARETLHDAEILAHEGSWNSAMNRLYYACFYAVLALLFKHNIKTRTHAGAKTQFGLMFIMTGIIDKKWGAFYSDIFTLRQKGDYADFIEFDEKELNTLIPEASAFIAIIRSLLI
ncbi:MAG: HEPN domain-containing protein [Lentimicrobium sp.]